MKYDAITFDTQLIQQQGFRFDMGLLAQLKQFKGGPTKVVVSAVIASEIVKHLTEKARDANSALESALRKAQDFGILPADADITALEDDRVKKLSRARLDEFLSAIGAEVVGVDKVPMRDVFERYFKPDPPFSTTKKHEFPDAVALLSLEIWARDQGKAVLAVTKDTDWMAYAATSSCIDVIDKLDDALSLLQEHADEARKFMRCLLQNIHNDEGSDLYKTFSDMVQDAVESLSVYAEADSHMHVEPDSADIEFLEYDISDAIANDEYTIVQVGQGTLVANVPIHVSVTATASFSLSIYDSIDKDYVGMGSTTAVRGVEFECSALISFVGDVASKEVKLENVELVDAPDIIDFGEIEPDWGWEDYEEYI